MSWALKVHQKAMNLLLSDNRYIQSNKARKEVLRERMASQVENLLNQSNDLPIKEAADIVIGATIKTATSRKRGPAKATSIQERQVGDQAQDSDPDIQSNTSSAPNETTPSIDDQLSQTDEEIQHVEPKEVHKFDSSPWPANDNARVHLGGVVMTLKDDLQGLVSYVMYYRDKVWKEWRDDGWSESGRDVDRVLSEVYGGLRTAQDALDQVSLTYHVEGERRALGTGETLELPVVLD